jgi:hypothetical protein
MRVFGASLEVALFCSLGSVIVEMKTLKEVVLEPGGYRLLLFFVGRWEERGRGRAGGFSSSVNAHKVLVPTSSTQVHCYR